MSQAYPQESMGKTLLEVRTAGEYRRVYARDRQAYFEVGEIAKGPLVEGVYGVPVHTHCVQLAGNAAQVEEQLTQFFCESCRQLSDLMDELDAQSIAYGYLNTLVGSHVSYRPPVRT